MEIDKARLEHNLDVFRSLIKPETQILANLKGNAYGLGASLIGRTLEKLGIDYFSVAFINEGMDLRKAGIKSNILVFNPSLFHFKELIEYELEPEVSSIYYLRKLIEFLKIKKIKKYPVHIKLDTGMHRAGIEEKELDSLIDLIHHSEEIKVKSIFSHLAAAEDPDKDDFTKQQFELFDRFTSNIKQKTGEDFFRHILNTAGVFRFTEKQYEMIRPGLGIFGYNLIEKPHKELLPIAQLKTNINQIKTLQKGESAGYNNRFTAIKDNTTIALLPLGYADGIDRRLGNGNWKVHINGKEAPIIGAVSMDTMSIDISGIKCNPGDEVIVFDNKDDIYKMAALLESIPYEMTTRLTNRVERRLK